MLWEVDIYSADGQPDLGARDAAAAAAELHLVSDLKATSARGYLIQGDLNRSQVTRIANELLADRVVERTVVAPAGDAALAELPNGRNHWIHVLPKPGVMDPVAQSAMDAVADFGLRAEAIRTLKKYAVSRLTDEQISLLCSKVLANDAIEQVIVGPMNFDHLQVGSSYQLRLTTVPIRTMDDAALRRLSLQGQLYLSLVEMQTIQTHFRALDRDPTDVELETVAQTWSEHCSHKTLAGRIDYRDPDGHRRFENMLKETIFAATQKLRQAAGERDWCVSVFADNAGVIRFDEQYNIVFKVETHNHPSALEPYGGANTGLGGVIRDPMGTGMGAKPICNTDVFCFAPPDTPAESLPPGVLHPRRVMKGVVAGVRDYGNRMGIPTVNGALYFDPRYLGNPLVYCGNIGLIPCDKSFKHPQAHDLIVVVGGRTGRDGIHGATFSSAELNSHSETVSGGAVQIGNAITEKMLLDVLLVARDRGLYSAVTDCGAGGLSSAVGEMGEKIGAEVHLERVPLKYEGLSYTEIWISEAQERMVFSVPPEKWDELSALCASEGVEATVIGAFVPTGRLILTYDDQQVADLTMQFLHDGRPPVVRDAVYTPPNTEALHRNAPRPQAAGATERSGPGVRATSESNSQSPIPISYAATLAKILGSLNVCSKQWVIRQYDHEVQGGSVVKPLVGAANDGPSDAAVVRPVLHSRRGIVMACGMNPRYGDFDTYWMAASAIDEAVRNGVAVGADPERIAILDNFCWGTTDRPETLGSLVRAALACHDVAIALGTPFISGKDSLNNEFRPLGAKEPISIPPSLLISALGQVDDVARCVTMDLKTPGNLLYLIGTTKNELGGSHYALVDNLSGGEVPKVDPRLARETFAALHKAIHAGFVRACHDLSEGGLAVAAAEMAFAGGLGANISLAKVPYLPSPASGGRHGVVGAGGEGAQFTENSMVPKATILLFSESNTRFLCEVQPANAAAFETALADVPHARIGEVVDNGRLEIVDDAQTPVVQADLAALKEAWQKPLRWVNCAVIIDIYHADKPMIRAVVFDMDGLMFNTEDVYTVVGTEMLRRRGHVFTQALKHQMMGLPPQPSFEAMIRYCNLSDTWQELSAETGDLFIRYLPEYLAPMPGLLALLDALEGAGIPKAIATSSKLQLVEPCLTPFDMQRRFQFILTAEDIVHGKPNPEIYLMAAERFGVAPSEMMVLEDSENGCRAGASAGAFAVAVPGDHSQGQDFRTASLVADSLSDPRIHRALGIAPRHERRARPFADASLGEAKNGSLWLEGLAGMSTADPSLPY